MIKISLNVVIFMLLLTIGVSAYDDDPVSGFDNTGWNPPLSTDALTTDSCCTYDSAEYHKNWDYSKSCNHGQCGHTGVDIGMGHVSVGDSVYAIANGTIIGRRLQCTGDTSKYNMSVTFIRHSTSDGEDFIGIYGHMRPKGVDCNNVKTNSEFTYDGWKYYSSTKKIPISKGEVVGKLVRFGDVHLHFGLAKGYTSYNTLISGWGRYSGATPPSHFINPETYLVTKSPERNFWTGNGSIISHHAIISNGVSRANINDSEYPYGITQDVTVSHSRMNRQPIGFFQWQISDRCSKLKIDYEGNSKANITIGAWNSRSGDLMFKNVSLPFILGESNTGLSFKKDGTGWYVVAVRLNDPISSSGNRISATCTNDNSTTVENSKKLKDRNIFVGDYHWNGNGSIISRIYEKSSNIDYSIAPFGDWPFGAFKDVSVVHKSQAKPVVFFQWMSSNTCKEITIDAPNLPNSEKGVALEYKSWSDPSETGMSGTLPLTLSSDGRLWTVLKVQFLHPVSEDARVYAICKNF